MNALEVTDVEKGYRTPECVRRVVLRIDEFAVGAGEHVALRGASGSGKTTFLNLIAGIVAADAGRILVAGREMSRRFEVERDRIRASCLGYVFQSFNLLEAYTALENVVLGMSFGGRADVHRARALLERMELGSRAHHHPSQLSVGQQQRVAIARAIAARPALVLADEPTGNLDPGAARNAVRLIREVCSETGAALLLVSHDDRILAHFDRCFDLDVLNVAQRLHGHAGTSPAGRDAGLAEAAT